MFNKIFIFLITVFLCFSSVFAQSNESFKVGIVVDMTGSTSSFGISIYSAVKMATDEINSTGGINGRKIELFLEDGKGTIESTRIATNTLIKKKNVNAIIGEATSGNSLEVAKIAQKAKIPMITPSATNPTVTKVGNFIFRACFTDTVQGEAMANFVFNELKLKKVATLTDTNSSYSKELTASFSKTFLKLGGKIVARGLYEEGEEDYSQLLQGMKNSKPQAIYIPGYYTEIKDIARQSAELNIETIFLGGDGWDSPSIFEGSTETLENAYLTDHFSVNTPNEKVKTFVANYKKLFNLEPDSFAALGYDSLYILADSLKRAGTSESLKLRDAVAQTRDFAGVTGKLSLNAYRDARKEIIMVKISKQNFTYHSIIPPK